MEATVLEHPSAWPEAMNQNIDLTIAGMSSGTEVERERSEQTLRTAIDAYLETHDSLELEDLTAEYVS